MLELEKRNIHRNRLKSQTGTQVTLDDDFIVPDTMDDISEVILDSGIIQLEPVKVQRERITVRGKLDFHVLYRKEEGGLQALGGSIPFEEAINVPDLDEKDYVSVSWQIEDLNTEMIHSRKLGIKAIVTLEAKAESLYDTEAAVDVRGEDDEIHLQVRRERIPAAAIALRRKDTYRLKQDITLPGSKPAIERMLWTEMKLAGGQAKPLDGQIHLEGTLMVFALYEGGESGMVQWVEEGIPFSGEVEMQGAAADMIPVIGLKLIHRDLEEKPDYDGEERILVLELSVSVDVRVWREEEMELLTDLYSLREKAVPVVRERIGERLLVKNAAKCRVTEQLEIPESQEKILQICACEGTVRLEKYEPVENGIRAEGTITAELLYITTDDNMPIQSAREIYPFSQILEIPDMQPDVEAEMDCGLEQLSAVMMDQEHIEIKAVIQLNLMAFLPQKIQNIEEITEEPLDMEELQNRPGLVGYIAKAGDDLWTIAKENHTTIQDILETNGWTEKNLQPGDAVLIVKQIG